jgi:hypothetical protein
LWSYEKKVLKTGLQFCGLMMEIIVNGINTMFTRNRCWLVLIFLAVVQCILFLWRLIYHLTKKKAFETARIVMTPNLVFDEQEAAILEHVFEETNGERIEIKNNC